MALKEKAQVFAIKKALEYMDKDPAISIEGFEDATDSRWGVCRRLYCRWEKLLPHQCEWGMEYHDNQPFNEKMNRNIKDGGEWIKRYCCPSVGNYKQQKGDFILCDRIAF